MQWNLNEDQSILDRSILFQKRKHERSALFFGGSDIHSSAELIRSVKIDGTVVPQALGCTSTTLMAKKCSCKVYIMNVLHTHTRTQHVHI